MAINQPEQKGLVRRIAATVVGPFPGVKRFIVLYLLSPVVNGWTRYQQRRHRPRPDPARDLRLLKLEAGLHMARVGADRLAAALHSEGPVSVLMDLRITQIAMRERGIPRYSSALALALPKHLPDVEISYLIDPELPLPEAIEALREAGRIVSGPAEIPRLPAVTHYLQSCIFELHKDVQELFPVELAHFRPRLLGIVYDVIPWLFPEQYLTDDYLKGRYEYQLSLLPYMHQLFAISECARMDTVRAAYLPPERVSNIYGGIDEFRWARAEQALVTTGTAEGAAPAGAWTSPTVLRIANEAGEPFTVRKPYWLYVGGGDFRKNVEGLVRAFALLRRQLPSGEEPSLLIACALSSEQRGKLSELADALGLRPGQDVFFTGFVSDATLASCYRNAFATVFPSLYEGLGLPVLESYHFGVPALASDVSSLVEVTAPGCQFSPHTPESIAQAMLRMHQNPELRSESLAFGQKVLATCNWDQAAGKLAADLLGPQIVA